MDKWLEVSVKVNHTAVEAAAELLRSLGATNGVVIEDPVLVNTLRSSGAWELCAIPEQKDTQIVTVKAYYPQDDNLAERLEKIEQELQLIEARIGTFRFGPTLFRTVSEQDWANEWKQYFHVTRVGKHLVIKPSWESFTPEAEDKVIELDPGMAFGTGTHHTTNMCMEILEQIVRPGMQIFDVGTGSGILSMTAALLGATNIKAVDIDATAVRVAAANIRDNHLEKAIEVKQGDLLQGTQGQADIIIANIIAAVILMLLPDIPGKLQPHGLFLASGIIGERSEEITTAAVQQGLKVIDIHRRGEWVAILMEKEN
ncbi:MAG: 50S ribosomal protein L11 methyltransferase [Acidaminococcaceae bacterium]|nr:50S ribosomal protein L11 methyltransferase [Acidaminococcaceae bacterium]